MRTLPCRIGVVVVCVACALVGCGTTETKSTPDGNSGSTPTGGAATATSTQPKPKANVAGVGDSLTLEGSDGLKMQVTLLDVIDPVAVGEFDAPEGNKRIVGVRIAMRNVSQTQYDDSPSNGSVLIYGADEQADSTIVAEGECSGGFAVSAKIAPGARRQGCVPFEVPNGGRPKVFQFTLESGFGPQAGEWSLRGASQATASSGSAGTSQTGTSKPVTAATGTDCGNGVFAGPDTSCPFAKNVRSAWRDAGGSPDTVRVFSPVTNQTYTMTCDQSGGSVTCTGGNDASVTFKA
jgi:hypothetical protein